MAPELSDLEYRYQQIYDDYAAGHLSPADASAAADALRTVDGAGSVWKVNTSAEGFLCADDGASFAPRDPALFVPLQHPGPTGGLRPAAGTPPWATPPVENTPGGGPFSGAPGGSPDPFTSPGAPFGGSGPIGGSSPFGGPGPAGSGPVGGGAPGGFGAGWAGADALTPPSDPVKPARTKPDLAGIVGGLRAKFSALPDTRKRVIIGVAVGVVVLLFLGMRGGTETTSTNGGGLPPATTVPGAPPAPVAPTTAPTPDDVNRVLAALTGPDRPTALAQVVDGGPPNEQALNLSVWAGLKLRGYEVVPGPAQLTATGAAQRWEVRDVETQQVVNASTVVWLLVEGTWKIETFPVFG